MVSNLAAVRHKPETRKPATGATRSLFKSIYFLYEKFTLILKRRTRNTGSICNHDFQNNYTVKFSQLKGRSITCTRLQYQLEIILTRDVIMQ